MLSYVRQESNADRDQGSVIMATLSTERPGPAAIAFGADGVADSATTADQGQRSAGRTEQSSDSGCIVPKTLKVRAWVWLPCSALCTSMAAVSGAEAELDKGATFYFALGSSEKAESRAQPPESAQDRVHDAISLTSDLTTKHRPAVAGATEGGDM